MGFAGRNVGGSGVPGLGRGAEQGPGAGIYVKNDGDPAGRAAMGDRREPPARETRLQRAARTKRRTRSREVFKKKKAVLKFF